MRQTLKTNKKRFALVKKINYHIDEIYKIIKKGGGSSPHI